MLFVVLVASWPGDSAAKGGHLDTQRFAFGSLCEPIQHFVNMDMPIFIRHWTVDYAPMFCALAIAISIIGYGVACGWFFERAMCRGADKLAQGMAEGLKEHGKYIRTGLREFGNSSGVIKEAGATATTASRKVEKVVRQVRGCVERGAKVLAVAIVLHVVVHILHRTGVGQRRNRLAPAGK